MRSKNLLPVQVVMPSNLMGGSQSIQKAAFEEALQHSIETSLRSTAGTPRSIFSSLFLNFQPSPSASSSSDQESKPNSEELDKEISRQNAFQNNGSPKQLSRVTSTVSSTQPSSSVSVEGPPVLLPAVSMWSAGGMLNKQKTAGDTKQSVNSRSFPLLTQQQQQTRIEQMKHLQRIQAWQQIQKDQSKVQHLVNMQSGADTTSAISNQQLAQSIQMSAMSDKRIPPSQTGSLTSTSHNGLHASRSDRNARSRFDNFAEQPQLAPSTKLPKGYCKAGKDIRLVNVEQDCNMIVPYPSEYVLLALQLIPNGAELRNVVIISLNLKSLPPSNSSSQALSVQCIGCGEKSIHTFIQLSEHIGLESAVDPTSTRLNSSQLIGPHAQCYLIRDPLHPRRLIRGPQVMWNKPAEETAHSNVSASRTPLASNSNSLLPAFRGNAPNTSQHNKPLLSVPTHYSSELSKVPALLQSSAKFNLRPAIHAQLTRTASVPTQNTKPEPPKRQISSISQGDTIDITDELPPKRYMLNRAEITCNIEIPHDFAILAQRKPVVMFCHPLVPTPRLIGDASCVVMTSYLTHCYKDISLRAKENLRILENSCFFNNFMLVITVQYLASLGPRDILTKEGLSCALLRAKQNLSNENSSVLKDLGSREILIFAKMAAAASQGAVEVVSNEASVADGISRCLKNIPTATCTYQVVAFIATSLKEEIHFHVVVTDKAKCRALAENLDICNNPLSDINLTAFSHLQKQLSCVDTSSFLPSHSFTSKLTSSCLQDSHQSIHDRYCKSLSQSTTNAAFALSEKAQKVIENDGDIDLTCFTCLRFIFLLPPSNALLSQTIRDISNSGILSQFYKTSLPLSSLSSQVVVIMEDSSQQRLLSICKQWDNSSTLLVLIQMDAHSPTNSPEALKLLNSDMITNSRNFLVIQCTSAPYSLLTDQTRIPADNQVYANAAEDCDDKTTSFYFGSNTNCSTPFATTSDPSYQLHKNQLLLRYHDLHSSVVACELLINQYKLSLAKFAAMDAKSTLSEDCRKYESFFVDQMIQDLLESCQTASGMMVIVRINSTALAANFHDAIKLIRNQLNMDGAFEVLLHNDNERSISLSASFLHTLKKQRNASADWFPSSLDDLTGITSLVIYEGCEIISQTMPRTLKYVDMRLAFEGAGFLTRSKIEQELSLATTICCGRSEEKRTSLSSLQPNNRTPSRDEFDVLRVVESEDNQSDSSDGSMSSTAQADLERRKTSNSRLSSNDIEVAPFIRKTDLTEDVFASSDFISLAMKEADLPAKSKRAKAKLSPSEDTHYTPIAILPEEVYDLINLNDQGEDSLVNLPPDPLCSWIEPLHPVVKKKCTFSQLSSFYRSWTTPVEGNPDYDNVQKSIHSKRLLLVTPPGSKPVQICCLFLQNLYRSLMKMIEVEIYDDQEDEVETDGVLFRTLISNALSRGISQVVNSCRVPENLQQFIHAGGENEVRRKISTRSCANVHAFTIKHWSKQDSNQQLIKLKPQPSEFLVKIPSCEVEHRKELIVRFVVPKNCERHCAITTSDDGRPKLNHLRLKHESASCIKTPIVSFGVNGVENGLFDLSRTLSCPTSDNKDDYLQVIIVRDREAESYRKMLLNHILVILPTEFDYLGRGGMKFAAQVVFQYFYEIKSNCADEQDCVWPFVLFMNDDAVAWTKWQKNPSSHPSRVTNTTGQWHEISLYEVIRVVESCASFNFAAVGLRPWNSKASGESFEYQLPSIRLQESYVETCIFLNLKTSKRVKFSPNRFGNEDIDWSMRASAARLNVGRFVNLSVVTRVMTPPLCDVQLLDEKVTLVTAADTDFKPIPFHPGLLLEKYFSRYSSSIFPQAKSDPVHPVLCVDYYISLGAEICVQFTSSNPNPPSWTSDHSKQYGGLLLHCTNLNMQPEFLQKFSFVEGATVCVIGNDRSSLRQIVVNLNLETLWHFRLTDEFQTSNDTNLGGSWVRPLYFLTGVKKRG